MQGIAESMPPMDTLKLVNALEDRYDSILETHAQMRMDGIDERHPLRFRRWTAEVPIANEV